MLYDSQHCNSQHTFVSLLLKKAKSVIKPYLYSPLEGKWNHPTPPFKRDTTHRPAQTHALKQIMQLIRDCACIDNPLFYCLPVSALLINSTQAFQGFWKVPAAEYALAAVLNIQLARSRPAETIGGEIKKEHASHLGFLDIKCCYKVKW